MDLKREIFLLGNDYAMDIPAGSQHTEPACGDILGTGVSNIIIPPIIDYFCACPPIRVSPTSAELRVCDVNVMTLQGNCDTPDLTGGGWCYVDPQFSSCHDLRGPANQPWSYEACTNILAFADMTRFEMAPPHFQVGNIITFLKYSHVNEIF